ncbi:hypothetical protein [Massilia genomosp. 1]|uniref:Uncharacterized protein n=1 Tax=Massilia genomosp. 1 TaxID=2609280 RepID=A0ABX0MW59_9BURK|nr:hypothetical protein [Massilia genomosp. 1]NHZ66989.1 hypothetical protein [Massilia genomosp. 1]
MLKMIALLAALAAASPAFAAKDLAFPIIESMKVVIDGNEFELGLYGANDKSRTNFVYAVYSNDYLVKIGVLDGAAPAIVPAGKFQLPPNLIGIQFIQGGHQRTLKYFSFHGDEAKEVGSIGTNSACIFQRPGKNGVLESVDEDRGNLTLTTYKVEAAKIRKFGSTKVSASQTAVVTDLCEKHNLLLRSQ